MTDVLHDFDRLVRAKQLDLSYRRLPLAVESVSRMKRPRDTALSLTLVFPMSRTATLVMGGNLAKPCAAASIGGRRNVAT